MNFQTVLDEINAELRPQMGQAGKVADYIPALGRVPAERFGIALRTCDGQEAASGDSEEIFSVQSISKVFSLTLAMKAMGEELWQRIGREPSGTAFNSLIQLELEDG
ncbi:MAG: glutaminase, partial [Comamonadaceae bacterium]